jgi:DNA polymerase I-like protein with 3'-5' exonuclease and polymerase domains
VLVATGRVSSDAQQFPKAGGIRECICARDGCCICSVDYGGLELRTMSQRAIWEPHVGFSNMANALNAGKDVHTLVAAQFLATSYEELLPRVKSKEKQADQFRALAKIFNFGKGGGMGAGAMAYNARAKEGVRFCLTTGVASTCGVTKQIVFVKGQEKRVCTTCIAVSQQLGESWLRAWPEQQRLVQIARYLTVNRQKVSVTVPRANLVRGQCGYTQWLNTPFQGLGAALVKDAMWRVSREMHTDRSSPMWGGHLNLNVHDELCAEFPLSIAPRGADRMARIMRETAAEWLPDLGPSIEADPALSYVLSKGAKTLRDPSGVLQVWVHEKKAA